MRVATSLYYELVAQLFYIWYDHLPAHVQALGPPNLITSQLFDAARGDFMKYHTDMRPVFESQRVSMDQYSPVLSLNLFMDMDFWVRPYPDGKHQCAIRLVDGMSMYWPRAADFANKHGVWFPRPVQRAHVRIALMFRWSNGRTRRFAHEYPYRLILTEEERRDVARRHAAAEAQGSM